jgi:hypothetical protein
MSETASTPPRPAARASLAANSRRPVCGLLVIYGPQLRAAADAREGSIVEQEDRAFCSKFYIGPETGRYAECAAGLKEIRTRYLERSASESIL